MKIQILEQENNKVHFLIEREEGMYNNVNVISEVTDLEVVGLSEDEVKTLAYLKVKPIAVKVFSQIEPLNEGDNPVDFELVPSRPVKIEIIGNTLLEIGDTQEYSTLVYDQYNQVVDLVPIMENKVIEATKVEKVIVKATLEDLVSELNVDVIARQIPKEEILETEIADLWYDSMVKDMKLSEQAEDISSIWYEIMLGGM